MTSPGDRVDREVWVDLWVSGGVPREAAERFFDDPERTRMRCATKTGRPETGYQQHIREEQPDGTWRSYTAERRIIPIPRTVRRARCSLGGGRPPARRTNSSSSTSGAGSGDDASGEPEPAGGHEPRHLTLPPAASATPDGAAG
jgi:hypothetical protein